MTNDREDINDIIKVDDVMNDEENVNEVNDNQNDRAHDRLYEPDDIFFSDNDEGSDIQI